MPAHGEVLLLGGSNAAWNVEDGENAKQFTRTRL
jgi:hypothetical protein